MSGLVQLKKNGGLMGNAKVELKEDLFESGVAEGGWNE